MAPCWPISQPRASPRTANRSCSCCCYCCLGASRSCTRLGIRPMGPSVPSLSFGSPKVASCSAAGGCSSWLVGRTGSVLWLVGCTSGCSSNRLVGCPGGLIRLVGCTGGRSDALGLVGCPGGLIRFGARSGRCVNIQPDTVRRLSGDGAEERGMEWLGGSRRDSRSRSKGGRSGGGVWPCQGIWPSGSRSRSRSTNACCPMGLLPPSASAPPAPALAPVSGAVRLQLPLPQLLPLLPV